MIDITWSEEVTPLLETERLRNILHVFIKSLGHEQRYVSLYLTIDKEIRELNQRYRGIDKPTDVLSWSYWEDDPNSESLGDLVISIDRTRQQAADNGWDEETELIRLLAHGCAHLAGYDHEISHEEEQRMLTVEIDLLKRVGLEKVYLD